MDFDKLTSEQVDALNGIEREAWYEWARGDKAKARAILGLPETATKAPAEKAVAKPGRRS